MVNSDGPEITRGLALVAQPNGRGRPGWPKLPDAAGCSSAHHGHHTRCTRGGMAISGVLGVKEGNDGRNEHEEGRASAPSKVLDMGLTVWLGRR
jgi:hypothetical protein